MSNSHLGWLVEVTTPEYVHHHLGFLEFRQSAKESRQAPELVLAPALKRGIVALGALHAPPHEHADQLRHDDVRSCQGGDVEKVRGRSTEPLRSNPLPGHRIVGLV